MRKTEILKIKGDWQEVVNDCRATVGKSELGKEPSVSFKRKIVSVVAYRKQSLYESIS